MTISFTSDMPEESGYDYKKGDVVEDAEAIFGPEQAKYLLECGLAEAVGAKTEKATSKKTETPGK